MDRKEAKERFNNLPKEHRITIIANECYEEIKWLEREKAAIIKAHAQNLKRINNRIKIASTHLAELKYAQ